MPLGGGPARSKASRAWSQGEEFEGRRGVQPGRSGNRGEGRTGDESGKEALEATSARLLKALSKAFWSARATHPRRKAQAARRTRPRYSWHPPVASSKSECVP